jgi:site-specific DNA-methyltransferase (adenine-specific)
MITSPPYFNLRFYGESSKTWWPDGWYGELGREPTLEQYIEHMADIMREAKRVLKKTGNFYFNIGDKFNKKGHLMFIPEQLALRFRKDGWCVKNKIIWYKHNHSPNSKKRGWTPSYEFVYHMYKDDSYFFDLDAVRIPHETDPTKSSMRATNSYKGKYLDLGFEGAENIGTPRARRVRAIRKMKERIGDGTTGEATSNLYLPHHDYHPLGKNPGDMWMVNTKGSMEEVRGHFATFPLTLLYRMILSSCPKDGVVMDIFAGSGTTAEAVEVSNGDTVQPKEQDELKAICPRWEAGAKRRWIMLELNPKYVEIIQKRLARYGFYQEAST